MFVIPDKNRGRRYRPLIYPARTLMRVWRRGRSPRTCASPQNTPAKPKASAGFSLSICTAREQQQTAGSRNTQGS